MGHAVIIREYTPDDKSRVMNLIRLNTPEYFAPEEEADAVEVVRGPNINFADHHTTGKISWDIIHPAWQRKSLGTRLLQFRLEKLKSIAGIRRITVRTSQAAYRFYQKRGFVLNEIKKDYWADGLDLYGMEYKGNVLPSRE